MSEITVVMATYNGEQYLKEQIQSILDQSMPPVSILIFDDGSNDESEQIADSFDSDLIHFHVNEKNKGVTKNFIDGILATKTPYIALADQDDIWEPQKLEKTYHELINIQKADKPAVVFSDLCVIDQNNQTVSSSFWAEIGIGNYEFCLDTLLFGNFMTGCTLLMNHQIKSYLERIQHDTDIHDAWIALIAYTFGNASGLREPLVRYRQHQSNLTFSTGTEKRDFKFKLLKHLEYLQHPERYLHERTTLIAAFLDSFKADIPESLHGKFQSFLKLKNRGYLTQKLAMRKTFAPYWR
ncbi:MAG: glycosyltransferase family 2 protein [Cytophagales bacterium]|nr:glycosyltransferase family 2 protein [Cytophagales bacterium]